MNIVFLTIIMTLLWTAALLISLIGKAHKDCNRYGASGRPVVSHTPRLQVFLNSYQGRWSAHEGFRRAFSPSRGFSLLFDKAISSALGLNVLCLCDNVMRYDVWLWYALHIYIYFVLMSLCIIIAIWNRSQCSACMELFSSSLIYKGLCLWGHFEWCFLLFAVFLFVFSSLWDFLSLFLATDLWWLDPY